MRRLLWLVLVLGAPVGCADTASPDRPGNVAVFDSAGVRIVSLGAIDRREERYALDTPPLFEVGWSEHPDSLRFTLLFQGAVTPDGKFVVADLTEFHVLRSSGSLERSVGGRGAGPGEFSSIWGLSTGVNDTIHAFDLDLGRLSTFHKETVVETRLLPVFDRSHRSVVRGYLGGDPVLLPTGSLPIEGPPDEWYEAPVLRVVEDRVDTLRMLDFAPKGSPGLLHPMGWSVITRDRVAHSKGDEPRITWYDVDGDVEQITEWDDDRAAVSDSIWDGVLELLLNVSRYRDMPAQEFAERTAEWEANAPERIPTYSRLLGDGSGGVWMSEFVPSVVIPTTYTHFRADGTLGGALRVPPGFDVLGFGDGLVLGAVRDEYGAAAAVAYRFVPSHGPGA